MIEFVEFTVLIITKWTEICEKLRIVAKIILNEIGAF